MRLAFMGTPEFAVPSLAELIASGHEIVAVYSQPPRPKGRGRKLTPSPVHAFAEAMGLPVFTPESMKSQDAIDTFASLDLDAACVVAYGQILKPAVLEAPRLGCFNLHGSLLPRWRGAAPIQRAIMAGDEKTGMMVMKMDKGLDTGPVALAREIAIAPDMTAGELHDALSSLAASSMVEAMEKLEAGDLPLVPQPEAGVLYAAKISKEETRIDFSKPAAEVHNRIRGLSPFPGAWFELEVNGRPERVKVLGSTLGQGVGEAGEVLPGPALTVACGEGAVRLTKLQKAGGKPLAAEDFLRGTPIAPETRLA